VFQYVSFWGSGSNKQSIAEQQRVVEETVNAISIAEA
jgi:hypothetical protein